MAHSPEQTYYLSLPEGLAEELLADEDELTRGGLRIEKVPPAEPDLFPGPDEIAVGLAVIGLADNLVGLSDFVVRCVRRWRERRTHSDAFDIQVVGEDGEIRTVRIDPSADGASLSMSLRAALTGAPERSADRP